MVEHHNWVHIFYSALADKIVEERELFLLLAKEEEMNSALVKNLHDLTKKNVIKFDEGTLRTFTIMAANDHVKDVAFKAERNLLSISAALAHALDLESALVRKIFINSFISDDEDATAAIRGFKKQAKDHQILIREKLSVYREKNNLPHP